MPADPGSGCHPPYIIMVTIKGEKSDIISGLEAGADDYLSKLFDPEELRARIDVGRRMLDLQAASMDIPEASALAGCKKQADQYGNTVRQAVSW